MGTLNRVSKPTIVDALSDPKLFAPQFPGDSWRAWRAFLAALFGLPLEGDALDIYRRHTGRDEPPEGPVGEAYAIVGRRGGKSRIAALVGVYLAAFRDYADVLARGERGVVMLIAPDRRQARVVMGYVRALLESPLLAGTVRARRKESIDLRNGISIEVHTASYRTVRGYSIVAAVLDELAFWRSEESAEPDVEILRALRPAMATVPGATLIGISTPYSRRGALWRAYQQGYGKPSSVLVWQAEAIAMNPTLEPEKIEQALEEDPAGAAAEWLAEFRSDIESFVSREAVEACVVLDRHELPPVLSSNSYIAFCDPSGGSRDSFTLAVAHREGEVVVLDCVREVRPPFSPESVVEDFADVLKSYGIFRVHGDRYAGEWPREAFRRHGVEYRPAEKPKSDLYLALLPLINSGRVGLLDHAKLVTQLVGLERRTSRAGKDSIDHPPGGHDDLANAVAGAAVAAASALVCDLNLSPDLGSWQGPSRWLQSSEPSAHWSRGGRWNP